MKPVKTPESDVNYTLPGGTEANDLPAHRVRPGFVLTEWDLTDEERAAIADGARVELGIYSEPIPPVHLAVVTRDGDDVTYIEDGREHEAATDR